MAKASTKTIMSRIDWRIKAITPPGEKLLSDRKVSLLCGDNPDLVRGIRRQFESGRQKNLNIKTADKLATGLQTTPMWLLREEGPETIGDHEGPINQPRENAMHKDFLTGKRLGVMDDIESDAPENDPEMDMDGDGQNEFETINAPGCAWGMPVPFLKKELQIAPGRAIIVQVQDDTMQNDLSRGDRAIINLDNIEVSTPGIFALYLYQGTVLEFIHACPAQGPRGKRLLCSYGKPVYGAPFEVELADVRIVGRVVGKFTKL